MTIIYILVGKYDGDKMTPSRWYPSSVPTTIGKLTSSRIANWHSHSESTLIMSDLLRPINCIRHLRKAPPPPKEFAIAMWNVRGLTAASKRETLGADCDHYSIDLVCIQETKVEAMSEQQLYTGHRLTLMQQKQTTYQGLSSVIGPRLRPCSEFFVCQWLCRIHQPVSANEKWLYHQMPCY